MSLKDYESEGSAIRRIMNEKLVTHHDRGVDTPHYQATMKKQGKVKLRKSGDYDDHGTHTVYVKPEDAQKYMAKGYKKVSMDEEVEENINIEEGLKDQLTPKLIQLLRMGMVDQEDLEVMKRAIKTDRNSLQNPLLRDKLYELL